MSNNVAPPCLVLSPARAKMRGPGSGHKYIPRGWEKGSRRFQSLT